MKAAEEGNGASRILQMVTMTNSNLRDPTIGMMIGMVEAIGMMIGMVEARAMVDVVDAVDAIIVKMVEAIIKAVIVEGAAGDPGMEEAVPEAVAMAVVVTRPSRWKPLFKTP
jgi:hypothetical protein